MPSINRNVAQILLHNEDLIIMMDCGEGSLN